MMIGFNSSEAAGACVVRDHRSRHRSRGHRVHGQARDQGLRGIRPCRLPARCRGAADHRSGGLGGEIATLLAQIEEIAADFEPADHEVSKSEAAIRRDLEGPQGGFRRDRPDLRLLLHGRGDPAGRTCPRRSTAIAADRPRHELQVANIFHAGDGNLHPLILYNANDRGREEARRKMRRGDPEALRRAGRMPDRRAWRRHREARAHGRPVQSGGLGPADAR